MGTTAEKLAHLKESKEQIKTALETPSNVMSEYSKWIKKYVQNQTTNIVSDGVCKNALDVPLISLYVGGQSEQKQYEGYNLFNNDFTNYDKDGLKIVVNDDKSMKVTGNITLSSNISIVSNYKMNLKSGVTYYLSGSDTVGIQILLYDNDNSQILVTCKGSEISYTPTQDLNNVTIIIRYVLNYTFNTTIYPMLTTISLKPYEKYVGGQPSPNPYYPQDIEVIDGVNLFDGKCLNGYYSSTGDFASADNQLCTENYIEVEPNETYWLGIPISENGNLAICLYDKNQNFISRVITDLYKGNGISYTIDDKTYYIKINFSSVYGNAYNNNIIITKGTTPKPYLPYGHIGLRQSGANEFNADVDTITFEANEDKTGIFGKFYFEANKTYYISYDIISTTSTSLRNTATISSINLTPKIRYYESTLTNYNATTGRKIWAVTVTDSDYYNISFWANTPSDKVVISNIMVTTEPPTSFEPYHEPKLILINLNGNTIAKVGDVKDLLKIYRNGDVEIGKKIRKVVLDGSEYWNKNADSPDGNYISFYSVYWKGNIISICDKFIGDIWDNIENENGEFCWSATGSSGFRIRKDRLNGYTDSMSDSEKILLFKTWLSTHNTEVYCPLATPETIKLPSIEPITLWEGTNKFELITNLDTTFEMEYVVNKNNILDEIQTAMLDAEIEI